MSTLKTPVSIPRNVSSGDDLDYQYLKRLGISYIESLGGNLWTDYNAHDPGVTILEMLCYALTDLGQRIETPVRDLLKPETGSVREQFYEAGVILPSRPTTALDYRKLFIDLEGVRNCWLFPYERMVYVDCKKDELFYNKKQYDLLPLHQRSSFDIKGLYRILVDFDIPDELKEEDPAAYEVKVKKISEEIRERYNANRNLCEDLVEINAVGIHPIAVCAVVELEKEADEDLVNAQIYFAIEQYFSPEIRFYSLPEMYSKGYRTDQIFDGPLLDNGFIDPEELKAAEIRTEVRMSDIMNLIMSIDGVKYVRDISVNNCDAAGKGEEWLICVEKGKRPVLCNKSNFSFAKDVLPVTVSKKRSKALLMQLRESFEHTRTAAALDRFPEFPEGEFQEVGTYTTIQNDFPDVYGIGRFGLPSTANGQRKSQAKQLKAYLLFFDQILASYFAHLGNVKDLLSVSGTLKRTYFAQAVEDIRGFDEIVSNYSIGDNEQLSESLFDNLDFPDERLNKLLNHLLARFAEKFSEYAFLMKELYGNAASDMVVDAKRRFLSEYVSLSQNRGGAFNHYKQKEDDLWDTNLVSGAAQRIALLAGVKNYRRRNLSESFIDIYPFTDSENNHVFRWRIKNAKDEIMLTSTESYPTMRHASAELYLAVLKIIETDEETVSDALVSPFEEPVLLGNLLAMRSPGNKYSFDVVNTEVTDPHSADRIIARQYSYYGSVEALCEGMLELIAFMKHEFSEEGVFVIEHILLRPDVRDHDADRSLFLPVATDSCKNCSLIDPYSYRVSVVLPGYTQRFANPDFRAFMEEMIREELPAHVLPRICWIGNRKGIVPDAENDLLRFETAWRDFLFKKTNLDQEQDLPALMAFKYALTELNTIYPEGRLLDCADEDGEELDGKIILGRTNLGTL